MKAITYRRDARGALQRMPRPTAERIVAKIEAYAIDPASQVNNVKALKGEDAIRLRVGGVARDHARRRGARHRADRAERERP